MGKHKNTQEEMIAKIESLERLNQQLISEKNQEVQLDYAWAGNLGHWYWDYPTN